MKTLRLFQSPRQQDSGSQGPERREDGDRGRRARDERKRRGSGRARENMGKEGGSQAGIISAPQHINVKRAKKGKDLSKVMQPEIDKIPGLGCGFS